jgi:NADH:ubiquinone reductase (H+-translocating)
VTLVSRENFVLFTPMLHEVAAGELYPGDIVNPIRRILRHVTFVQAEVHRIDMDARAVRCIGGVGRLEVDLEFDHLLVALGSETNSFDVPGVAEWAVTMKSLTDAALCVIASSRFWKKPRCRAMRQLDAASSPSSPRVAASQAWKPSAP